MTESAICVPSFQKQHSTASRASACSETRVIFGVFISVEPCLDHCAIKLGALPWAMPIAQPSLSLFWQATTMAPFAFHLPSHFSSFCRHHFLCVKLSHHRGIAFFGPGSGGGKSTLKKNTPDGRVAPVMGICMAALASLSIDGHLCSS